jgi:murein DD-endopeptidase MepM/ murein hydrolase activator NlpD
VPTHVRGLGCRSLSGLSAACARTVFLVGLILTGGCTSSLQHSPRTAHRPSLPDTVIIDDENGKKLELRVRSVVASGYLSSGFGARRDVMGGGASTQHTGIDIAAGRGSPVRPAAYGTVVNAGLDTQYGRFIRIRHSARIETFYAHLSRFGAGIRSGVPVTPDDTIGYVGSTGHSTGPHLHFEVRRNGKAINPLGAAERTAKAD